MYKNLEDFRAEKRALRSERDRCADALATRWEQLQDPTSRGVLIRDAFGDALMGWKPYRSMHDLLHGRVSGQMISSIGVAAAGLNRSWTKRLLYSGLSILLGKVIGRNGVPEGADLLTMITKGIGTVVKRFRAHRARSNDHRGTAQEPGEVHVPAASAS